MTNTETRHTVDAPPLPAAMLAVSFALFAVFGLTKSFTERIGLVIQLLGFTALALGYAAGKRDTPAAAVPMYLLGTSLVLYALVQVGPRASAGGERLVVVIGMVGLASLVAGLIPLRRSLSRPLTVSGTGLIFLAVVVAGILELVTLLILLLTATATITAWDLADHSISLGRQVGRRADTVRATAVHAAGTLATGAGLLVVILFFARLEFGAVPLLGLVALLLAGFALILALRH